MRNTDIRCSGLNTYLNLDVSIKIQAKCELGHFVVMFFFVFFFHHPMLEFLCKHLDLIESVLIKYTKYRCSLTTTATRTEGGLLVLKTGD